ncbi:pyridoxamine 5'-phosphate oxidase family protein [Micromonospora musae]|uniref:hypothetical protein n=1 Tax=Micromonospora musae TaxID=1894970 RepID=UPI002D771449|nr:hypothetical protein [Micromonospora musae]
MILTGPGSRKARNLRRDPRVALSLTPANNPAQPIIVRGRVIEWLEADPAKPAGTDIGRRGGALAGR